MKSIFFKYVISTIIFLILVFFTIFLVQPLYNRLTDTLISARTTLVQEVKDKTGLDIHYASLSPSILSAIRLNQVEIVDSVTGTVLISLNRVYIRYNLISLIQGDILGAINEVIVNGGVISYNQEVNYGVVEKLQKLFSLKPNKNIFTLIEDLQEELRRQHKTFELNVPFVVSVRNIIFEFENSDMLSRARLDRLTLNPDGTGKPVNIQTGGFISLSAKKAELAFIDKTSMGFSIKGSLNPQISGSNVQIVFNSLDTPHFTMKKSTFFLSLDASVVTLRMIQNILPFNMLATFDTKTQDIVCKLNTDNLDLVDLISFKNPPPLMKKIRGSTISGTYQLLFNAEQNKFDYSANGSASLTSKLLAGGLQASYQLSGNDKKLAVADLKIASSMLDASFQGSFDFKKLLPQGYMEISKFLLPNKSVLQTELFIDEAAQGFFVFFPQLSLENQTYTALQMNVIPNKDSLDFSFEAYDYSHIEAEKPGRLSLDGSLILGEKPYLQSRLSFDTFFLDSIAQTIFMAVSKEGEAVPENLLKTLSPYIITNDFYFSSDFKSIVLNAPTVVVANTQKDREFVVLSVSANENSINLSQMDMLYAGYSVFAQAQIDITEKLQDAFFTASLTVNNIPYRFSGSYSANSFVNISGDYNFEFVMDLASVATRSGHMRMSNFPLPLGKRIAGLSVDSDFNFTNKTDWNVTLMQVLVQELTDTISIKPRIGFSGSIQQYGLFLDSLNYADTVSQLAGSCNISWVLQNNVFDSLTAQVQMLDARTKEKISLNASASNPGQKTLETLNFLKDMYFSLEASVENSSFSRFMSNQKEKDCFSLNVSALGTLESPYISLTIPSAAMTINGQPLEFASTLLLEDEILSLRETKFSYLKQTLSDVQADLNFKTVSGSIKAQYRGELGKDYLSTPVEIKLEANAALADNPAATGNPLSFQAFSVQILFEKLTGSFFKPMAPLDFKLVRTPGRIDLSGGYNGSVKGYYLDSGDLMLSLKNPVPLSVMATGSIRNNKLDIQLDNISADLAKFKMFLSYPFITVNTATVSGSAHIGGLFSDPEFSGVLSGKNVSLAVPDYVTENILTENLPIYLQDNSVRVDNSLFHTKNGLVQLNLLLLFDRWMFDSLTLDIKSLEKNRVAGRLKIPLFEVTGQATCDLQIRVELDKVYVGGTLQVEDAIGVLTPYNPEEQVVYDENYGIELDFKIMVGQRAQVFFPSVGTPLVRGLVSPQTPLSIKVNSAQNFFEFKGDLNLRGGEIIYLKRNFYLKEGRIFINANQDTFDPHITLRAEVRERDEDGKNVTIILTAINQLLSKLSPSITSSPPKSEREILMLLGQVFVADMSKSDKPWSEVLTGMIDYGAQVTIFRTVETELRKLIKFDIFSMRTLILQNAMLQAINSRDSATAPTIGNYLDNSTVYIGKYFGNALYLDAMLHLVYDEKKIKTGESVSGLVFQPEIGFEMASPFATIRWSLAPDISAKNNLWVPYNSISLSWKFTY